MPSLVTQHGFVAICFIILIEEAGLPLPIPSDVLLLFAGALAAHSWARFALSFLALTVVSSAGTSVYWLILRRGGRPLVERFGRYIHLDEHTLARGEAWLKRSGWWGIVLGRALPFVRHPTAIACGVLGVPFRRYFTAQLVGGAVYDLAFLILGALFGPSIIEAIHLPRFAIRIVGLLLVAVGLPTLLWWLCTRIQNDRSLVTTRREVLGPMLIASVAGTVALSATWAAGATIAAAFGSTRPLNVAIELARWLVGRGVRPVEAYLVVYGCLVVVCIAIGFLYDITLRPHMARSNGMLLRQTVLLSLIGLGLLGLIFIPGLIVPYGNPIQRAWERGGSTLMLILVAGIFSYSVAVVCGHTLAVALRAGWWPEPQAEPVARGQEDKVAG